jgi:hypothetical protein
MEETHAIAEDVISGFHKLLQSDPEIVESFLAAFKRREHFAGLPETKGLADGLEEVLAGLLSSVFTVHRLPTPVSSTLVRHSVVPIFDSTIRRLEQRHPITLLLLKKRMLRRKCGTEEALAALFRFYAANAEACPY